MRNENDIKINNIKAVENQKTFKVLNFCDENNTKNSASSEEIFAKEQRVKESITLQKVLEEKENFEILESIKDAEEKEKNNLIGNFFNKITSFLKSVFSFQKSEKDSAQKVETTDIIAIQKDVSNKLVPIENLDKNRINGEIDEAFKQGHIGDCTLLASLVSLANTEQGEELIKNAISKNYSDSGKIESYNVYFKGLNKTYCITANELKEAKELKDKYKNGEEVDYYYSSGDDDVLLFELAYTKAFDDIAKEKKSSNFNLVNAPGPKGLDGVALNQFLYGFIGIEKIKTEEPIENKYIKEQIEIYKPKILELFENEQEFTFKDVIQDEKMYLGGHINGFNFDKESVYVIEQKTSEAEDENITIIKKGTEEKLTINADYLAEIFASYLSEENIRKTKEDMYNTALESDFAILGCKSKFSVVDVNGEIKTMRDSHSYGIKEINQNHISLVDPWDSKDEITISKDEYLKHFKYFKLQCANFED